MRSSANPLSLFSAALASLSVACSDTGSDQLTYEISDSAGVEIVISHRGTDFDRPWTFSEAPLVRIGKGREEDPYLFTSISGAVRLTDGSIVVRESRSVELRRFDSLGNHVVSFSGKGGGPGEFTSAWAGIFRSGDTLQVLNYDGKTARFSPEGSLLDETPGRGLRPGSGTEYSGDWLGILPNDRLWGQRYKPYPDPPIGVVYRDPIQVVISDPQRTEVRVLGEYKGEARFQIPSFEWYRPSFITLPWQSWKPSGVLVGDNETFIIDLFGPQGEHLRRMKYPGGVRPPEQWQLEGHRSALRQHTEARGQAFPQLREWIREVPDPETWPGFIQLVGDEVGYVWAMEYVPTDAFSPSTVDVPEIHRGAVIFHPDGYVLGQIELPADLRVFEIGDDYLLGVETDSLGVQEVVLYGLSRG